MKGPMRLVFFLFLMLLASVVHGSEIHTRYNVSLDLKDFSSRNYTVKLRAMVTNHSDTPLDHLVWMLYPNRYQTKLPHLDDINLHRIYPHGYSKGNLVPMSVTENQKEVSTDHISYEDAQAYGEVFLRQNLLSPLLPGDSTTIEMELSMTVPHKFGSFGWYRKELTLSGGWSPVLLSYENKTFHKDYQVPLSDWHVHIDIEAPYKAVVHPPSKKDQGSWHVSQSRQVSVKAGKLNAFTVEDEAYVFTVYHDEPRDKVIRKPMEKLIGDFVEYIQENNLDQRTSFALSQAPLREMLVVDGTPLSYFSDRAFKVIGALDYYHQIPIFKALFMQLYEQDLSEIEHERDLFWVQEVVAWRLTEELVKTLDAKHRDARDIGILQALKFLPLIDRVLFTPQFAFYDVFYNLVYPQNDVRDEFRRYPNKQPFGQTILAHMEDEFGKEQTHEIIMEYIQTLPTQGFRNFVEEKRNKDLEDRFGQWTSPRPRVNYRLGKHYKEKIGDQYHHSITIEQEASRPIVEPVTLKVSYKNKTSETQTWMSTTDEHTFQFLSDEKIKAIEIDPENRLLETLKSDNRRPAYWKFVILSLFVEYDFEENQPLFLAQGQIRKRYGGLDRFDIGGFYQFQAYGVSLGYTRLFGKIIDTLRLSHGFRAGLNFNGLTDDFSTIDTGMGPSDVGVTPSGYATDLSLSYIFGNQLSYINPLKGSYGSFTFRISNPVLGTEFDYRLATFNVAGIVPIHPNHLWGIRFRLGTSGGDEMPSQLQYRLGGILSMRGLPLTNDDFTGKHVVLLSNEYRHLLIQDMDINLWLFRIRRIQGALYSNAGHTTHTVREQARVQAGLQTGTTGFSDLLNLSDWKVDVGYGLRVHIHYLGVSPSLLSFDIARSVTDTEFGWLFYIGVNQTF